MKRRFVWFFVCVFCLCFFFVFISFIFRKRSNSFFNLFYECFVVLFLFFYEKYSFVGLSPTKGYDKRVQ